jgi:hypothetical protein
MTPLYLFSVAVIVIGTSVLVGLIGRHLQDRQRKATERKQASRRLVELCKPQPQPKKFVVIERRAA